MWKLSDKELMKNLPEKIKNPKVLLIIGLAGILLIGCSSLFGGKSETKSGEAFNQTEYEETIEKKVFSIVKGITGDRKATVIITLKNGIRYSYADDTLDDTNMTDSEKTTQQSSRKESNHITVKDSSGEEKALVVTENMPEIRGVAIVCKGGGDSALSEEIKSAVMAALDITAKRIYITESGK